MMPASAMQVAGGLAVTFAAVRCAVKYGWMIEGPEEVDKAMALTDPRCRRKYWIRDAALLAALRRIKRKGDLLTHVHNQRQQARR